MKTETVEKKMFHFPGGVTKPAGKYTHAWALLQDGSFATWGSARGMTRAQKTGASKLAQARRFLADTDKQIELAIVEAT